MQVVPQAETVTRDQEEEQAVVDNLRDENLRLSEENASLKEAFSSFIKRYGKHDSCCSIFNLVIGSNGREPTTCNCGLNEVVRDVVHVHS